MADNQNIRIYVSIPQTEHRVTNIATIEAVVNKAVMNNGFYIDVMMQSENVTSINDEIQAINNCDIVITDFVATNETGKDPHPDCLLSAVFAKYILGKKLIILHNQNLESYFADNEVCEFSREDANDSFECLYNALIQTIMSDDISEFVAIDNEEKDKIFVSTPLQGRFFRVRNDFDFTRVFDVVSKVIENQDLPEDTMITSVERQDSEVIWNDLFDQIGNSKLMILDFSCDVDSGRFPNAHVLTEYLIAKYRYGINAILTIRRDDESPEDHWTNLALKTYSVFSEDDDLESLDLYEIINDAIVNGIEEIVEEQILDEDLPIIDKEDSDESDSTEEVVSEISDSNIDEEVEASKFAVQDDLTSSDDEENIESADNLFSEDFDMTNKPENQQNSDIEETDGPKLIEYTDDDSDNIESPASFDMSDKDEDYTAYDGETEMSLFDPILDQAQSQIFELEMSREKALKRSKSTRAFLLEHRLTDETRRTLNNLYKELKWAVIGKKKYDCLNIMFKIMRLNPYDPELSEFIKTFPDLYDEVTKEVHTQIVDFLKFDSDQGNLYIVDVNNTGDFLTVGEAVNVSKSGDLIIVMQGEYEDSLSIIDKDINLRGLNDNLKPTISTSDKNVLTLKKTKSIINNLILKQTGGKEFTALDIIDCSPIIENCEITSASETGIHILGRNAIPFMRYNKIHDCQIGIHIENQARAKLKLNEIWDCKKEGIKVEKVSDPTLAQNLIRSNLVGISINGASKGVYYENELIANKRENIFVSEDSNPVQQDNKIVTYFKYHLPELRKFLESDDFEKAKSIWDQLKQFALKDPRLMNIIKTYPDLDPEFLKAHEKEVKEVKQEDFEWDFEPEEMTLAKTIGEIEEHEEEEKDVEPEQVDIEEIERVQEELRKADEEREYQHRLKLQEEELDRYNKIKEEAKRIARERLEEIEPDLRIDGDVFVIDHEVEGAYDSIQTAINLAKDGDAILISPREYDENIYIKDKTITLVGEKIKFAPLIKRESGSCLRLINTNSKIMNIDFIQNGGGNFYAIDISDCSPTIENCLITCESIAGIGIYNENANPTIANNRFEKGSIGIKITKSAKAKIVENEFDSLNKAAVSVSSNANPEVLNNSIVECYMGVQVANEGRGTYTQNSIENSTKPAFYVSNESQCEISDNVINNLEIGVQISNKSWVALEENEIKNTSKIAVTVSSNAEAIITRNSIVDAQIGIQFTENSRGTVDNNELIRCAKIDILVSDDCEVEVGHNSTKSIVEDTIEQMKLAIQRGEFEDASEKWLEIFNAEYYNPLVKEVLLSYPDFEPEYKKNLRSTLTESDPDLNLNGYIWVVDSHVIENRDFDSIQAAVQKATDNDLILVRPATYEETIVISRKHLTITGMPGEYKPKVNVEGGFCFRVRNTKSVIKNLSINQLGGGNYYAVDISSCSPRIENCELSSQSLASIGVSGLEANPIIRNNKITGGTSGIAVTNSAQCLIEGNEITESVNAAIVINNEAEAKIYRNNIHDVKSTGVNAYNTAYATIEENEIIDCELAGIGINTNCEVMIKNNKIVRGGLGVIVTDNSKCEIIDNEIEKCLDMGVTIKNNSDAKLHGNLIQRCKKSAILITSESTAIISKNEISKNTKDQIVVSSNSHPKIIENIINYGSYTGISVFEGCKPIIDGNEVHENTKAGIQVNENADAEIYRNKVWGNSTGIIVLQQSTALIQENEVYRNDQACIEVFFDSEPIIKNNNLYEGKLFGIILRRHSKGKIFENRIWNNEKVGIRINDGSEPEIRDNLIYDNKWNGIKIHKNGKGFVSGNEIYSNKVGIRIEDPYFEPGENNLHDNFKNDVIRID